MRLKKWATFWGVVLAGVFLFKNIFEILERISPFEHARNMEKVYKSDSGMIAVSNKAQIDKDHKDVGLEVLPFTPLTSNSTLTLFKTLKDVRVRRKIHNTMLRNWASLAPALLPVLFVTPRDDPTWSRRAEELGWKVEEAPRLNEGVPVLKDMFQVAAHKYPSTYVGFANADNLFGNSLIATLDGLTEQHWSLVHHRKSLIVGRRRNFNESLLGEDNFSPEFVDRIAPKLELYTTGAQDYFIFSQNSGFCWENVPDFVVGRIGYDNWLVVQAQLWNLTLIDATNTINDVHLVGVEGVRSGFSLYSEKAKNLNIALISKRFSYYSGKVTCSHWNTMKIESPHGSQSGVFLARNRNRRLGHCAGVTLREKC